MTKKKKNAGITLEFSDKLYMFSHCDQVSSFEVLFIIEINDVSTRNFEIFGLL